MKESVINNINLIIKKYGKIRIEFHDASDDSHFLLYRYIMSGILALFVNIIDEIGHSLFVPIYPPTEHYCKT